MASTIKDSYAASSAVTITLASLATSPTFVFGREGTAIDNTTTLAVDYLLGGKITSGTSPAAAEIRVYVVGTVADASWPDVFDGTDSDETVTTVGILNSICKLAAVITTTTTNDVGYWFGPISVASLFGGSLPLKFSVFVAQNTTVNLNATGGNHVISITAKYLQIV